MAIVWNRNIWTLSLNPIITNFVNTGPLQQVNPEAVSLP
jgi:hypothetical protein